MKTLTSAPQTAFDVYKIRQDFPILTQRVHGHPLVYLDNAATSQKPKQVIAAMEHYYREYNSNIHRGVHHLSELATQVFEDTRSKTQHFINAQHASEIIFVRGATEAINLVAQSYGRTFIHENDEILITEMEHHANIVPWQILCEQIGATLRVVPFNEVGEIDLDTFAQMLNDHTKLVAFTHISNALGTINPVKEMTAKAHEKNIPVLIDGAQAAPHTRIDMQDIGCDFYTFSGHKMFAPTGIGVLYGKKHLLEKMPPWQGGGEMIRMVSFEKTLFNEIPYKFEAGTPHIEGVIGLGVAIDYLQTLGLQNIAHYENELLNYATQLARQEPSLRIVGEARQKASILSFTLQDIHPHDLGTILDQQGIAIRTGHHCAMPVMQHFNLPATARASFAFYNTHAEIEALFHGIATAKKVFKL